MKTTDEIKLLPCAPNDLEVIFLEIENYSPRPVKEYAVMPSGDIVVMTVDDGRGNESLWFNSCGEHPKSRLQRKNAIPTPDVSELVEALRKCSVGSCNCMTKSPDPQYHAEQCQYKMIAEALAKFRNLQ